MNRHQQTSRIGSMIAGQVFLIGLFVVALIGHQAVAAVLVLLSDACICAGCRFETIGYDDVDDKFSGLCRGIGTTLITIAVALAIIAAYIAL